MESCLNFLSIVVKIHHDNQVSKVKQLGKETVYFILQLVIHHPGKSDRNQG